MKYHTRLLSTLFVLSTGMWSLPQLGANAVTLGNGAIAFAQPPRLVSASTPYTDISVPDTTYYFTLEVPATAGEPLQQVTFNQIQGIEDIEFNQNDTFAFEGTRQRQGTKLALKAVKNKDQQNSFTVTFDSPIPPGKTVTIGLRAYYNPFADGIYLIGVTAFPSGQQTVGQFLGIGRLQFYQDTYPDS
ncbi:DUF2808 domain-containing protein [Nostoc sp. CENA67]|uniref:DUF2808 domain-containing protein n=1 Tax=Amazonocrinis nigriterrae CENA67 TaxID=2794033 RepID=A0A8J7HZD4_9NOST|nr:DUF2808 domain-containing protein [Amazonocrinis nigriterrae]MBH8566222.1 DUF2808 domain-containing protein [Amazonocrinis nigriterrae CENA67]